MDNIYGVVFKQRGKVYYFKTAELECKIGDYVIVETDIGLQYGKIVAKIDDAEVDIDDIKDILRIATKEDYEEHLNNLKDAKEALNFAKESAAKLNLKMTFLDATFTFNRKQLLLNFVADDRVDFRELAKVLAGKYHTRIELRQIGARDRAKAINGLGVCGRELCCASFLNKIDTISMNMAKNQNLALNPSKINGCCGRLLCCLTYEDKDYTEARVGMPEVGDTVRIDGKNGQVISIDLVKRSYRVNVGGDIVEKEANDYEYSKK